MIWIWLLLIIINAILIVPNWDGIGDLIITVWCVIVFLYPIFFLDVENETYNRPLKETIHVELKNGIPVDTTYTYE